MSKGKTSGSRSGAGNVAAVIVIIIMAIAFLAIMVVYKVNANARNAALAKQSDAYYSEKWEQRRAMEQKERESGFYEKLSSGFDVNVLILGDDIGVGSGAGSQAATWTSLVKEDIWQRYGSQVNMTNLSMSGSGAYSQYVRVMTLERGMTADRCDKSFTDYDLAIICVGHNDDIRGFSLNYENLIRAIRNKYTKCSIIAVIEASSPENTEKNDKIRELCDNYGILAADMDEAFSRSEKSHAELLNSGFTPNNEGHAIYAETVMSLIGSHVGEKRDYSDCEPINKAVEGYESLIMVGRNGVVSSYEDMSRYRGFTREDDTTYILDIETIGYTGIAGAMGIDYTYIDSDNEVRIYLDGKEAAELSAVYGRGNSMRVIEFAADNCVVRKQIKVVFDTAKQADGFNGICFSGTKQK